MAQVIVDEALLREPNLWVPRKKPIGPVKVDTSHPLAKGLHECWLPPSLQGLMGNISGEWINAPITTAGSANGLGAVSTGGLSTHTSSAQGPISVLGNHAGNLRNRDFSVMSLCIPGAMAQHGVLFCFGSQTFSMRLNSTFTLSLLDANQFDVATTSNTTSQGTPTFCGVSVDPSGNYIVYMNGTVGASGTTTRNFTDYYLEAWLSLNCEVYANKLQFYWEFGGSLFFTAFWHRTLSSADFDELYRDPYQFLIPA